MYTEHAHAITPPDATKLWRYMDVAKFLSLLEKKALYFSLRKEFEDKWEGEIPTQLQKRMNNFSPEILSRVKELFSLGTNQVRVNCWHANDHESVAMWALYTSGLEGVAIQTTISRIKEAIALDERYINIGRVNYDDTYEHSLEVTASGKEPFIAFAPLLFKRPSYSHEKEVRLLMLFPAQPQFEKATKDLKPKLGDTINLPDLHGDPFVKVCLKTLVEKIVVSPTFPPWSISALQSIICDAGLDITIELSDLIKSPPSERSQQ